jgi:hypothetical protein
MQEARSEPRDRCRGQCGIFGEDNRVSTHAGPRAFLESVAKRRILITYQELANALRISPPHSIHRVTEALERLMEEDAAADRPFIAALAHALAPAKFRDAVFATLTVQHNADFLLDRILLACRSANVLHDPLGR